MLFPKQEEAFFKIGDNMEEELTFEVLYEAYRLCLKNKKKKYGTYNSTNEELCQNLLKTLDKLNNRNYNPEASNCEENTKACYYI